MTGGHDHGRDNHDRRPADRVQLFRHHVHSDCHGDRLWREVDVTSGYHLRHRGNDCQLKHGHRQVALFLPFLGQLLNKFSHVPYYIINLDRSFHVEIIIFILMMFKRKEKPYLFSYSQNLARSRSL